MKKVIIGTFVFIGGVVAYYWVVPILAQYCMNNQMYQFDNPTASVSPLINAVNMIATLAWKLLLLPAKVLSLIPSMSNLNEVTFLISAIFWAVCGVIVAQRMMRE